MDPGFLQLLLSLVTSKLFSKLHMQVSSSKGAIQRRWNKSETNFSTVERRSQCSEPQHSLFHGRRSDVVRLPLDETWTELEQHTAKTQNPTMPSIKLLLGQPRKKESQLESS
ncbi:hypothetical protein XENOCAPTIV_026790 [Xenoophorus captivus]|uniref:Uncharacterized protein n=1 Tax=Xenoophorus captivus TaxID=1517983 RepID=A0ABV0S4C1_9TELE